MRKPEVILIVGVILVMLMPGINALKVEPSWVEFSGSAGDWQAKNITLINDENKTINVTIEASSAISDCYISNPKITLAPNERANITIGMQLSESKHGFIFYTYSGQQMSQFIILSPSSRNVSVDMIPEKPKSGGTIVFMLNPYDTKGIGFLYVIGTNRIYNFTIINGLAFVSLSKYDYGDAVAVFQGSDFQARKVFTIQGGGSLLHISAPENVNAGDTITVNVDYAGNPVKCDVNITEPSGNYYTKSTDSNGSLNIIAGSPGTWKFTVEYAGEKATASVSVGGSSGGIVISAPSNIQAGESKTITVISGMAAAAGANVMVQFPDGSVKIYRSDSAGQVNITFAMAGKYVITASYGGATSSKTITVEKRYLDISIPSAGFVGSTINIPAPDGSKIEIEGNGKTITGTAGDNGYDFIPSAPGEYTVHVETDDAEAESTLNVYKTTSVEVYDSSGNPVVSGVPGRRYSIKVVDSSGEPAKIDYVTITGDNGQSIRIPIADGMGYWIPAKPGQYIIESPVSGNYWKSAKSIIIQEEGAGDYGIYIAAIVIIVLIAIGIKYRDRILSKLNINKFKEEDEEELE